MWLNLIAVIFADVCVALIFLGLAALVVYKGFDLLNFKLSKTVKNEWFFIVIFVVGVNFFDKVLDYSKEISFSQYMFLNEVIADSKNAPTVQNAIRLNLADGKISNIEFRSLYLGGSGDKSAIEQYAEFEAKNLGKSREKLMLSLQPSAK